MFAFFTYKKLDPLFKEQRIKSLDDENLIKSMSKRTNKTFSNNNQIVYYQKSPFTLIIKKSELKQRNFIKIAKPFQA